MTGDKGRAVVLGASIAGLLASRVLADFFDEVLVFDKESLDDGPMPRKSVPQGAHIHAILTPTFRVLARFLPKVLQDLAEGGAHAFDGGRDWRFHVHGSFLATGETGRQLIGSSRPFFEHHVRRRVAEIPNIEIRTGHHFDRWLTTPDNNRVEGIALNSATQKVEVGADLLVDARGLGSTLSKELKDIGYEPPPKETVGVDLGYTTRIYKAPGFSADWTLLIVNPSVPKTWTGGLVERIEDERWIVTQFGYFGDHAPAEEHGFLERARSLPVPDLANFLERADPVSDFRTFGTRQCRMLRFEKLGRFPDRLLVMGDAVCALNPIYGQGMTKAAREAEYLFESLSEQLGRSESLDGFSHTFRRALPAAGAEWAWQLTSGADLGYPQATGKRQPVIGAFMGWYIKRLFKRSAESLEARARLFDVLMLVNPPSNLMKPSMARHAIGF